MSAFLGFGTAAKAAVATTTLVLALAVAGAAAGVFDLPGSRSNTADVANGLAVPGEVPQPAAEPEVAATAPDYVEVAPLPGTAQAIAPSGEQPVAAPRTTQAPAKAATPPPTTASSRATSAPAPPAPAGVARRTPSAAEVNQAIKTLPQYIKTMFPPTPALVAEIGNQVCAAFDQGHTFAEVKSTGLQMLTQLPRTTVLPGGADWAVRTVVALYCPGHAGKLV